MSKRKTRADWERVVATWRRSGRTAKEFAARHGIATGTLRWWAWALSRRAEAAPEGMPASVREPMAMIPVRIAEVDAAAEHGGAVGGVEWSLHTSRGELRVYAGAEGAKAMETTLAFLLGGGA